MTTAADSPEAHRTAARHYLAVMPLLPQIIEPSAAHLSMLTQDQRRRVLQAIGEREDVLEGVIVDALVRHFSADGLEALGQFFSAGPRKSVGARMPSHQRGCR